VTKKKYHNQRSNPCRPPYWLSYYINSTTMILRPSICTGSFNTACMLTLKGWPRKKTLNYCRFKNWSDCASRNYVEGLSMEYCSVNQALNSFICVLINDMFHLTKLKTKLNSMVWVRERTIPTERPPLVGEVIVNFCGLRVPRGQRDGSLRPYSRYSRQEPLLFYQVAPKLYLRGWVDPVPDPLLFFFW
jgi:hypothetical protein